MTTDEIKSFITSYTEEVWNQHSVDAMDQYYTADYAHHDVSGPDVRTLSDYKQWATMLLAGLSNFHVSIDDLIAEPGKAVKRWTASGLHDNTFAGIPPTGKEVQFSGVSVYRLAEDRIAESWYIYDMFGLLQQLAAMPTAAEAEA
jgi:steroid delta-isomerase-like uncharacterized protein